MYTMRSAISVIARIDGRPAGQHPLICRFLKSVFQERPSFSQCHRTQDSDVMLTHIRTMEPNTTLSIVHLSQKLTVLILGATWPNVAFIGYQEYDPFRFQNCLQDRRPTQNLSTRLSYGRTSVCALPFLKNRYAFIQQLQITQTELPPLGAPSPGFS